MVQTDLGPPPLSKYKEESVDNPVSRLLLFNFFASMHLRSIFPSCTRGRLQLQCFFLLQYHSFVFLAGYLSFYIEGCVCTCQLYSRWIAHHGEYSAAIDDTRFRLHASCYNENEPGIGPKHLSKTWHDHHSSTASFNKLSQL